MASIMIINFFTELVHLLFHCACAWRRNIPILRKLLGLVTLRMLPTLWQNAIDFSVHTYKDDSFHSMTWKVDHVCMICHFFMT